MSEKKLSQGVLFPNLRVEDLGRWPDIVLVGDENEDPEVAAHRLAEALEEYYDEKYVQKLPPELHEEWRERGIKSCLRMWTFLADQLRRQELRGLEARLRGGATFLTTRGNS